MVFDGPETCTFGIRLITSPKKFTFFYIILIGPSITISLSSYKVLKYLTIFLVEDVFSVNSLLGIISILSGGVKGIYTSSFLLSTCS